MRKLSNKFKNLYCIDQENSVNKGNDQDIQELPTSKRMPNSDRARKLSMINEDDQDVPQLEESNDSIRSERSEASPSTRSSLRTAVQGWMSELSGTPRKSGSGERSLRKDLRTAKKAKKAAEAKSEKPEKRLKTLKAKQEDHDMVGDLPIAHCPDARSKGSIPDEGEDPEEPQRQPQKQIRMEGGTSLSGQSPVLDYVAGSAREPAFHSGNKQTQTGGGVGRADTTHLSRVQRLRERLCAEQGDLKGGKVQPQNGASAEDAQAFGEEGGSDYRSGGDRVSSMQYTGDSANDAHGGLPIQDSASQRHLEGARAMLWRGMLASLGWYPSEPVPQEMVETPAEQAGPDAADALGRKPQLEPELETRETPPKQAQPDVTDAAVRKPQPEPTVTEQEIGSDDDGDRESHVEDVKGKRPMR